MRIMDFEITDEEYTRVLQLALHFDSYNAKAWNSLDFETRRATILNFLGR